MRKCSVRENRKHREHGGTQREAKGKATPWWNSGPPKLWPARSPGASGVGCGGKRGSACLALLARRNDIGLELFGRWPAGVVPSKPAAQALWYALRKPTSLVMPGGRVTRQNKRVSWGRRIANRGDIQNAVLALVLASSDSLSIFGRANDKEYDLTTVGMECGS